jgi:hypothetical protein
MDPKRLEDDPKPITPTFMPPAVSSLLRSYLQTRGSPATNVTSQNGTTLMPSHVEGHTVRTSRDLGFQRVCAPDIPILIGQTAVVAFDLSDRRH